MQVLVAGDFYPKNRVNAMVQARTFGQLFDQIVPIVVASDYSIVNFEFPIVLDTTEPSPISKLGPHHRGTIEAVDAVKYAGFKCCTLANNHILDQGRKCCMDTKTELEKAGVDTVGVGNNLDEAGKVLYKKVGTERLAIINCCEKEFSIATDHSAGANPLNPVKQYYSIQEARLNADYVLVIIHGGHEHYQLPSPRMQETYRFFIDAGADAVVNHHQHCFSGYEIYKNKPIFYGLGNFCFDKPERINSSWNEGYMVRIELMDSISFDIIPYNQCSNDVTVHLLDRGAFDKRLEELNNIIADKEKLAFETSKFYQRQGSYLNILEPFRNRFYLFAKLHGWLPSFISKRRKLEAEDFIGCESHRDILLWMFENKYYKNATDC